MTENPFVDYQNYCKKNIREFGKTTSVRAPDTPRAYGMPEVNLEDAGNEVGRKFV